MMMGLAKFDHEIQNCTRIGPPINVVTQCDDCVVMTKCNEVNEGRQCIYAAMNISNCEMTCHHKRILNENPQLAFPIL